MDRFLTLPDETALTDLVTYLSRADRVDRASVRLIAGGGVLAVYTAVLHPGGLLDETPTVLGLRTVGVDPDQVLDAVVPIASLVSRLQAAAPEADGSVRVGIPAEVATVTWAGVAPPRSGWQAVDRAEAGPLAEVARAGIVEVAEALPADAGEAIVRRVRAEVWGRPIPAVEHVPAGAAFAAHSLGFLGDAAEEIPVYESGPWTRLSARRGHVLVKRRGWSLHGA
ncbi:hypothetical protein [Amnibacterium endophyticum]|uniref:Uncharacterized protein n=1 Tax=Amnibacterium endophyticum TaxID=2109337 RepID=A0ABW4LGV2_9MICO